MKYALHMLFKAQISKCPAHGFKPKVRIELNRTFVRFKEFKAHVRLSSVAYYSDMCKGLRFGSVDKDSIDRCVLGSKYFRRI